MSTTENNILFFEEYVDRSMEVIYLSTANEMALPYIEVLEKITPIVEQMESFDDQTPASERTSTVCNFIESSNLETWPPVLRHGAKKFGSIVVDVYDIQLNAIFDNSGFKKQKSKYKLSIDQRSMEISKVKNIFLEHLHPLFIKIQELQAKRMWLVSQLPQIKQATSDEFDLGGAAKGFAAGVLAVTMPWYGVPALIAHGTNEYNKKKVSGDMLNQFDKLFVEYYHDLMSLFEIAQSGLHEAKEYLTLKFKQTNYGAVTTILQHVESAGEDVQYYFDGLRKEIPLLEEAETNLGIRKTARKRAKALTNRVKKTSPKGQTRKPAKKVTTRKPVKKK
jgi:hypothetical protein